MAFCLSGDDDKQKLVSIADNSQSKILRIILNRRHTQTRDGKALSAKRQKNLTADLRRLTQTKNGKEQSA